MSIDSKQLNYFSINSEFIYEENAQLTASAYSQDIILAKNLIREVEKSGIEIPNIGSKELSNSISWPGRFKRKYTNKKHGEPFLTPTEVFMFLPEARKYVTDYPDEARVSKNTILITRSGTIGRIIITNDYLKDFILSDDLIRLQPSKGSLFGFLYAYLNSWVGQAYLTKNRYGATVKHIEPNHVAEIPIPRLPEVEDEINDKIMKSYKLIEEAQSLLLEAEREFYDKLGLDEIDEDDVTYFGGVDGRTANIFTSPAKKLNGRLDASYHKPIIEYARDALKEGENNGNFKLKKLGETSKDIFTPPRFKRLYVKDSDSGVPLLQGTHIPMIKPLDIKFIWKGMKNISKYIVYKNWILITCSGTAGRIALVRDWWDGWTATNHMTRIIPKDIDPGFLTIFLQSPYGRHQLEGLIYGGVVDEIGEAGDLLKEILVPISSDFQEKIGKLVTEAYDKRDEAMKLENEAISELEKEIEKLSS